MPGFADGTFLTARGRGNGGVNPTAHTPALPMFTGSTGMGKPEGQRKPSLSALADGLRNTAHEKEQPIAARMQTIADPSATMSQPISPPLQPQNALMQLIMSLPMDQRNMIALQMLKGEI